MRTNLSKIGTNGPAGALEETRESMDEEEKAFFYGKKDPNQEIEDFFGNPNGNKK